jgi:RHS repeat-associated protein
MDHECNPILAGTHSTMRRGLRTLAAVTASIQALLLFLAAFPQTALAQSCPGIMWWPYLHLDQNCGLACDNDYANCLSTYTAFQCIGPYQICLCECPPDDEPPAGPQPDQPPNRCGDPVDPGTGIFTYEHTDLTLQDVIPIRLARAYRELDTTSRDFGIGMTNGYEFVVYAQADESGAYNQADLILPDAGRVHYTRISTNTSLSGVVFQHSTSPTIYFGSKLYWNGNGWTVALKDGTLMTFYLSRLWSITDRNGNTVQIQRDPVAANILKIVSPNGRWISFNYDSNTRVTSAQDNAGRTTSYVYNSAGFLSQVTDANGGVTTYSYDSSGRMLSFTTSNGNAHANNQYDSNNRVIQQTQPDGGVFTFTYTLNGNGNVTTTNMVDPRGYTCSMNFTSNGYLASDTWAVGAPEQQQMTYTRDPSSNLIDSTTDSLGRATSYTYDSMGNMTSVTRLSGTSSAATTSITYDPTFNQPTSVTDPLNHTWTLSRDAYGNQTAVTDPLGHQMTASYNSEGEVVSFSDGVGDTFRFTYDYGDLASIIDPLGNTTDRLTDDAGRLMMTADPLGNTTWFDYDQLGNLTESTDASDAVTSYTYDGDRNLTSVTDANGGRTSYTYDSLDRQASRTDPLHATETYVYDHNGNLVTFTDRRGVVTVYQYDGLNRRTFAGFGASGGGYQSTINYTWDAGNRMTAAADSIAGTITRGYDGLDNLVSETSPQGTVGYVVDAARRRIAMTVSGQPSTSYTWNNANRLISITQGSSSIGFQYDNANRRTQLALPNGVAVAYTYDADGHVTGITYSSGGSQLGNLTYSYDADGRVTSRGGTMASTGMPAPISGNTFNAANEMTSFNGTPLSYDANGNLTSDGTNTYTWDARNHLTGISGPVPASFLYDALGRRAAKSINGATTQFLYDRLNPVQELDATGTPTANLLTGLGIDEYFSRTDSAGPATLLADALGSTIGLSNTSGALGTTYTYEPFGNVTISGNTNANSFQFTSRENDGTGLCYYRARYYSPTLQRFVGQDPIGFAGSGPNLYSYVLNNPINSSDLLGLFTTIPSPSPTPGSEPPPMPSPSPPTPTPPLPTPRPPISSGGDNEPGGGAPDPKRWCTPGPPGSEPCPPLGFGVPPVQC